MKVANYNQFSGKQIETASLRNVLAHLGVTAPHSGQPFTEEMLFGIGGGIGLGYFVYASTDFVSLTLMSRITTEETKRPGFVGAICDRIGVEAAIQTASNNSAAEKKLKAALAEDRPVMVWVSPLSLPYHGTPHGYHTPIVFGFDDEKDEVSIADRSAKPLTLTRAQLAAARDNRQGGGPKFRAMTLTARRPLKMAGLKTAIKQGIHDCCDQMKNGFGPPNFKANFGLQGMIKWADLLTDRKDRRGWPKFFPAGPKLLDGLTSAFDQIENRGGGGSAFRLLYADFLTEAGGAQGKRGFEDAAAQFRESARLWNRLSESLLPDSVPMFKEYKQLAVQRRLEFEKDGNTRPDINLRLAQIRSQAADSFPLNAGEVESLLADLRERVLAIHKVESPAVTALGKVVK